MSVIGLKKANCMNCYKCVRVCPVKSIRVHNEQAEIIEEECILCGRCLEACPQNAKVLYSDLELVKSFLQEGKKVFVSLAPSFLGSFECKEPGQMVTALKKLGFYDVCETAQGAVMVTDEYYKLLVKGQIDNIVTTCCPTVNALAEKYYCEVLPYMAPVVSPMIAHGKMLKEKYGREIKVVFIGPCISKKAEAADIRHDDAVDAVLTFEELSSWMLEKGIFPSTLEADSFSGTDPKVARRYPISAGIIKSLLSKGGLNGYQTITISGIEQVKLVFEALKNNKLHKTFIEINACPEGCINGPAVNGEPYEFFGAQQKIKRYSTADTVAYPVFRHQVGMQKQFVDRRAKEPIPDEATIRGILKRIGKETQEQELNCGSCGYPSCRDKAIAVFQNKAQLSMCMPYMNEMTQSLSNVVLAYTPNIIIAVNQDMKIVEFNHAAESAFHLTRKDALNRELSDIIDDENFKKVLLSKQDVTDLKADYPEFGLKTSQDIIYVPKHQVIIGFLQDITQEEAREQKAYKLKMDTMEMAQKVIDKQMMVAQEIASLLGETTAETKVTLTKLKKTIIYDGEEEK